ncbi:MAG: RNA 2',3'-cyclic phosphodiesterase [Planctomycetes bacterium]|nr:RNA 2',3'-cyclic phosphodiesterase [Planctomycetota bacterium]
MKQKIRTFVAVKLDSAVCANAAELIEEFRSAGADARWVDPENLHVTLKFLGDVDAREVHEVCRAVEDAVGEATPFELEIRGAGAFPNAERPRTVWLGVGAGAQEMVALNRQIEPPLEKLGYRREARRYQPHLTIGRVRRGGPGMLELAALLGEHADFEVGRTRVREVIVFSSELGRSGPTYQALARVALGGRKPA